MKKKNNEMPQCLRCGSYLPDLDTCRHILEYRKPFEEGSCKYFDRRMKLELVRDAREAAQCLTGY